jgi:dihydroflavonol-4-reductase
MSETVLVTGGSGYIGGRCVVALLEQGYTVRTTIRDLAREAAVRASLSAATTAAADHLTFHAANLTSDTGWEQAAEGCDYLIHVASPLGVPMPKDPNDLIVPARDGARRAIKAAIKDAVDPRTDAYAKSKTIAERGAWDLIAASDGATTLATVNPALVLGPVLSGDFSESVQVVQRLLTGKVPGVPRLGFNIVDVRDVADLHLRAMTSPAAAGERFIAAGGFAWMMDLAHILRDGLGEAGKKVPTRSAPDLVVRLAALFDRDLTAVTGSLGLRHEFTSAKAERLLGWKARPMRDTVLDCAHSLIAAGLA